MNEKKFLIWVDILGFDPLAEVIASEKGIGERDVRNKFINVIKERVEIVEKDKIIIGKKYGESDDWILVTDNLDKVFISISEILDHYTEYEGYEKIPLEIAIGTGEYDKWAKFDGTNLIIEKDTIKFLKTNIVGHYHKSYPSPKATFIVLTESANNELEPLDKKICTGIEYEDKKKGHIKFFTADVDRVQQRGKVFKFMEKIQHTGYGRIDEIYVPPVEYEDIKVTLKKKRFIFITGTQEYGKTYTAVRLMWEYYNKGYESRWYEGGEERERVEVRKRLENIRAELKPGRIIYFEDPFGKIKYEKREGLEREIGSIIDSVKQVNDVYIIVTSREEVFREFENEKLSTKDLKEFEKKLNIKKPSYDDKKRKEMLLMWAENEDCGWFRDKKLKKLVLSSIKNKNILPTPLSIKSFVVATTCIEKEDELKKEIKEKSKETPKAFAKEIKNMSHDKILFLSFLFVSSYFEVNFIRRTYHELVKELNLRDAWEFDRVLNWFKDNKVNISNNNIGFSHPSYSEALDYLLIEDGYLTEINKEIFSKLLLKLSEKDKAAGYVAWAVAENFDKLPEDVRNKVLLKLSEKDGAAEAVAWAVARNFDKLPEDVRNLLFKLSEKDGAAGYVASAVAKNFDKLPEDVRNKLLLKLSEKDGAAGYVARAVAGNFDKLPEDVRNLLFKLSEKDVAAGAVAWAVAGNFDKLPEDVRKELKVRLSKMGIKIHGSIEPAKKHTP